MEHIGLFIRKLYDGSEHTEAISLKETHSPISDFLVYCKKNPDIILARLTEFKSGELLAQYIKVEDSSTNPGSYPVAYILNLIQRKHIRPDMSVIDFRDEVVESIREMANTFGLTVPIANKNECLDEINRIRASLKDMPIPEGTSLSEILGMIGKGLGMLNSNTERPNLLNLASLINRSIYEEQETIPIDEDKDFHDTMMVLRSLLKLTQNFSS